MATNVEQPTHDDRGDETHPAFGKIGASRISVTPGQSLFDSDILHQRTVRITVQRAKRQRDLNRDWIFDTGPDLIEVELSEAQWASFVSSVNTTGVPCTIRRTEKDGAIPNLPYDPRLAHSMDEVKGAAERLMAEVKEAVAAYEALDPKAGVKERRAAFRRISVAVGNSESNMAFAARSMTEHAEDVVQRARADIEAMVGHEVTCLGLTAIQAQEIVTLPAITGGD